jgi:VanZ family protein
MTRSEGQGDEARPAGWGAVLAIAGLQVVLSAQPDPRLAEEAMLDLVLKICGHLVLYAAFAFALRSGLANAPRAVAVVLVVGGLFAIADELHQSRVPGRTAAAEDVAIDALGLVAGLAAWRLVGDAIVARRGSGRREA